MIPLTFVVEKRVGMGVTVLLIELPLSIDLAAIEQFHCDVLASLWSVWMERDGESPFTVSCGAHKSALV